jgi:hypothetical protein
MSASMSSLTKFSAVASSTSAVSTPATRPSIHCSMVLFISSSRVSVSSKETDESLVVDIVFTESSSRRLRLFRPRRTPQGRMNNNCGPLSKLGCIVHEADRDEILKELVELVNITGRVGREVAAPLKHPLERRISTALAVDVPPTRCLQHVKRVRRRLRTRQRTG